ncbi:ComEC/Rec2 family competence protein [Rhodococcus sp. IEGM 1408]|uniref:ComEC/Rec2 family competence protein n=1 Tax=Rhodococcus sp. IEGM 1408 TaxID=3082220 RepID=UPI00295474FE|nr:ComEC/Rec2 family competence protein [Rhodococcus sp. IEGM 1408]MDV8000683.1 ComEC/Rec2 family competence protein [Rhodococcus sp. IEGM 1408]
MTGTGPGEHAAGVAGGSPPPSGRVPAARDLRLVLPTLALFLVTAATVGMRPAAAAALGVVLLMSAVIAVVWSTTNGAASGIDRTALGVLAMACALGATGAGVQAARSHALAAHPLMSLAGARTGVEAVVTGFDRPVRSGGVMVPVRVEVTGSGESARAADLDVVVLARDGWRGLPPGTRVRASVAVLDPLSPGDPPGLRALTAPAVMGEPGLSGRAPAAVRERFRMVSDLALDGEAVGLLPSFVLGDEGGVSTETRDEFRAAGLAHLAAVSGANTTYVVGAVLLAAAALGAGRRGRIVAAVLALGGFVAVVGPEPAVLRAAGTGAIGLAALSAHRTGRPLAALAAVVLLVALLDPATATGAGFVLSVTATAALVLTARSVAVRIRRPWMPGPVADVLAVCVVAHLATLPVLMASGLEAGPWSLPANIAVAPAVPVVTVLGTASAALGPLWEDGAVLLAAACTPALWWLDTVAGVTAALPGSPDLTPG